MECDCRRSKRGFERADAVVRTRAALEAVLLPDDRRIRELIERRQGHANAISIREIISTLWPEDLRDAKFFNNRARQIKACVERLRRFGRSPIAAVKGNPGGYFIPIDRDEAKRCHDRLFHEGIQMIRLSQLFHRDADLVRELEGQLGLKIDDCRLPIANSEREAP